MKIFKYELPLEENPVIEMPIGASILDIQYQNHKLMLWAMVSPQDRLIDYNFRIFGTGHDVYCHHQLEYIKTVQDELTGFVWHIFRDLR